MKQSSHGFTLVELLVALTLLLILMSSVIVIFFQSTDVYTIEKARINIYGEMKKAFRTITDDLQGFIPLNTGIQKFVLENGVIQSDGSISYGVNGGHDSTAADRITFRATTKVTDSLIQTVEITYELVPSGVEEKRKTVTRYDKDGNEIKSRPMYILKRTMKAQNPTDPKKFDQNVKDAQGTVIGEGTSSQELLEYVYVLSFNVAYFADNYTYSQLEPSPCPPADPLGDAAGANDPPSNTAYRIPKLRITIIVVDDAGDLQERIFPIDIDIPAA